MKVGTPFSRSKSISPFELEYDFRFADDFNSYRKKLYFCNESGKRILYNSILFFCHIK